MNDTGNPDDNRETDETGRLAGSSWLDPTGSPADRHWHELLRAADPLAEPAATDARVENWVPTVTPLPETAAWQATLQRLQSSLSTSLENDSLNRLTKPINESSNDEVALACQRSDSARQAHGGQPTPRLTRLFAALAASLLALAGAGWWFSGRNADEPAALAERRAAEQTREHATEPIDIAHVGSELRPPVDPSAALVQSPAPHDNPADIPTAENLAKRKAKIQSVEQLLKLRPSQLATVQRQLDVAALDQELRAWLQQWDAATPADRAALEGQWVTNRGFWVGWTLQGLREWTQPEALRAGIEVLSLEFGPKSAEALAFCWQRPATRALARPVLLPRADESQLAQWLWAAEEAEDLQALVTELAQRPGPIATQTLAKLAAEPGCQIMLRQADRQWSPQHLQRALVDLGSPQSQTQFHAAMLLTVLPPAQVERELQQKIQLGQQVLPALAVLLLNFDEQIPSRAQPLFQSTTVAAALPSARQRAQKWLRQQLSETPDSHSLRKVCQQCVTAT